MQTAGFRFRVWVSRLGVYGLVFRVQGECPGFGLRVFSGLGSDCIMLAIQVFDLKSAVFDDISKRPQAVATPQTPRRYCF